MFATRKEVDEQVHKLLGKLPPGPERDIKCLAVARLYIKIQEYSKAAEYLTCYLKVKDELVAHRLIAQCFKHLKQPDNLRALHHLQRCIQLNPRQGDVIREACQLILDDSNLYTAERAKYWLGLATEDRDEPQESDLIFSLRLKLNQQGRDKNGGAGGGGDADHDDETLEILMHKELQERPQDVSVRVRLLLSYVEKNKIEKAFYYAYNVELELDEKFLSPNGDNTGAAVGSPFSQSIEWYKSIWLVLTKYEQSKDLKKSWSYWHLTLMTLDRLMSLSLDSNNALADGTSQLFRLDQYLHRFNNELDKIQAENQNQIQRDFLKSAQGHFSGQLMLHAVSLLFKRELTGNKNKWMGTLRDSLPLLLLGYQINPFQNTQPNWLKHCDKAQRKLFHIWRTQTAFRCAQMGRTLLGCLRQDESQDDEECKEGINNDINSPRQSENQGFPSLWLSSDDLLSEARQLCADKQWRRQIYQILFTHGDHKLKEQTSHLVKNASLQQPLYDWPNVSDIESYEQDALLLSPQSLSQHVYLALCTKPERLGDHQRVRFYGNLRKDIKSNQNLSYCSPDSLTQIDIDIFLYAVVMQTQRKLSLQRENYNSSNVGNRSACSRPHMLPYINIFQQLTTPEQSKWWQLVQIWNSNHHFNDGNRTEQRAQLQVGLEAVRATNGPRMDLIILFQLGHILNSRQDRLSLQTRINLIFKQGFQMLRRQSQQELEPFSRYFKYTSSSSTASLKLMHSLAEKAVTYLSKKAFKENQFEEFIEEMRGLNLPIASYLQAEAYRMLGDCNRTTKSSRARYLEQRQNCLQQTQQLLKSQPEHALAPIIGRDIKRCQQEAGHLHQQRSPDLHNNSSTYEDAEDADTEPDYYAGVTNSKVNESINRSRGRDADVPLLDVDRMFKKITTDFCQFKEEVNDNFEALRQDVKILTNTLDDMLKKLKLGTSNHNQEVDPAAALGLDDLFIMEDLAVPPPPQQHGTQPPQQHSQQQQQSQIQTQHYQSQQQPPQMLPPNNHPGTGAFGAGPPSGFYNNGLPPVGSRPRNSNFNLPPNAMYGGNSAAGGAPYLDALGHYGQSPLAPPPGPSVPGSGPLNLADPTTPVGGIGSLANPTTTSFFNTPPTPITTLGVPQQLSGTQSQSLTQPPPQPAVPHLQPQKSSKTNPMNVPAALFNRALNNQPVEKEPPANVVITNSDPLPKADALTSAAGQVQLSVTIPAQHIKPSITPVPATASSNPLLGTGVTVPPAVTPGGAFNFNVGTQGSFNFNVGTQGSNIVGATGGGSGGTGGEMTFSFKPQVAQAAAEKEKEKEKEQQKEEKPAAEEVDTSFDGSAELDYDPRPDLQGIIPLPDEVEVRTGEEDEEIKFSFRAKLFRHVDKEWKERGIGLIKILRNNSNGIYRVLMRRDQTHKICANHKITKDMELTQPTQDSEKKSFIWAANDFADEHLQLETFLVRFKLPETALQFQQAFKAAQNDIVKLKDKQEIHQPKPIKQDNFVTSTPANPLLSKPLELVKAQTAAVEASSGPAAANFVAKSLFGATAPLTSTTTTSPFANFSFSNMSGSKVNSSPFGNLSFGSVSALSTAHSITSTNNTTLFTTALIKDSTVLNANSTPTPVGAITSATEAETDILEEYVPTAQFTPVIPLPELVEVVTGEENESILFEHRAKLLRYDRESNEWKERGLGNIKLLQSKLNPQQIRLVMRREQIHKLCCNQRLSAETKFNYLKNSQTALTWAAKDYSEGEMTSELLCIRFKTADTCKAFLDEIIKAQKLLTPQKIQVSEQKANEKKHQKNKEEADKKPVVGFGDAFKPVSGSWSCESCYTNNGAGQLHCLACEAPKDNSVPPKPVNAGGLDGGSAVNLSISTAGKFNFGFGTSVTTAATTTAVTPAASFEFGGSNKTKEKSRLPLVANAAPVAVTTSEPSALGFGPTKNQSSGFGDCFKLKPGSWTCSGCYVTNEAEIVSCKACETPKDGAEDKKNNKLGGSSNLNWPSATQFKFGFNSATPAIETPFGSANFNFTPKASGIISTTSTSTSSVPTSIGGTILGSNKFSFSMPKSSATEPKSPQADESANDNDYHVEEENNAYFAPVIPLPDKIEVKTGEEDEKQLYEHRAKLYRLSQEGEWKERGLGNVKILQHKQTHKLRVVMRREQVLKICLNHILDLNVIYKPKDEKSWMFAVNDYSEGENILERLALRFKTPEIAQGFHQAVQKALNISAEDENEHHVLAPDSAASKEIQNLAEKLKLNEEFLLSDKKCIGCRGCDVDSFEFGSTSVDKNGADSTEPSLPLYLPALKLQHKIQSATSIPASNTIQPLATNRSSIFKASSLSAAASGGFGSFGGFGQTISANSTISAKTNQGEESKPFATSNNSFAFGSAKTENPLGFVFSASNNQSLQQSVERTVPKSIFGQTLSKSEDGEKTKSIFGGTSSNLFDGSGSGSGTAGGSAGFVFGSSLATISNISFADIGKEKNQPEKEKTLSGDNSQQDSKTPVFGTFTFGSNLTNKEINSATTKVFPDLAAKAGDDFASLVAKGQNINAFQKSTSGGFYNLTHQNDFKNFQAAKVADGDTEKITASVEDEDADTTTDDNYDPYYAPIVELPDEIVVNTGEENETKLYGERTKLYRFDPDTKQWKERGVGEIKVLEHPELKTFRMVMRQEQIHKLVLNMKIGSAFKIEFMTEQGKSFLWANYNYAVDSEGKVGTEGVLERLACRFKKQEPADEFYKVVNSCIDRARTIELEAGNIHENDEEAEDPLNDSATRAHDEETETERSPKCVTEKSE
ncbi:E3 SUMO-protein ligase RanBP2 [Drosophila tropicalis]|uniref:E3 SUMO-protein ligase RanBP2 n=1 Tax=Drosophila tropicalis TaxID=46794 RepID=UPI0035AC1A9F